MFNNLQKFLLERKYTSQFFLSNIDSPAKMQELIAKNKLLVISNDSKVHFAAFISPTNILHIQGTYKPTPQVLEFASQSYITGVNGPTTLVNEFIKSALPSNREIVHRYDDIVFSLNVSESRSHNLNLTHARQLKPSDFEQWFLLYTAYLKELDIPSSLGKEERKQRFDLAVKNKSHWGLFDNDRLISIASFNATTGTTAQIGGVYTLPEYRGQGHGKVIMERLIQDSINTPELVELILYTGPMDSAPARLYVGLGFKIQDHYTMAVLNKNP